MDLKPTTNAVYYFIAVL